MKFLLLTPLIFLLSSQIKAEANNAKHEKCLQAADYEGCMDFQSSKRDSSNLLDEIDCTKDLCFTDQIPQKTDHLGMPIPRGWIFTEDLVSQTSIFWDPVLYKINSGGTTGRFFHTRSILRYFSKGREGSSGYFSNSGSGSINCSQSSYGNINCTTQTPSTTFIPGRPSVAPQVIQMRYDLIYDCEDHTVAEYIDYKFEKTKGINGKKRIWQNIDNLRLDIRHNPFIEEATNMKNSTCLNKGNNSIIKNSGLTQFIEKGIKKRSSSNKKNVGNINCDSPVWKNKPRCN